MDNLYDSHLLQFGNGHVIDTRFEIISNPVKRSFGVAYLCYDSQAQVKKILLFVPESIGDDAEAMANIRDGAALIRWLNHPHIARLYEFHSGARYHYFELEYVLGKNLRQKKVTSEEKRLSENIVKWLGIQILEALDYAHNNNVIHRDLKPQNVVLTPDGKVKLIDFGISEALRASTSLVWDTIPQTTVLYMSPEQLQGKQIAIPSDIYSLAATMYDLLSGKPPFFSGDVYHQIIGEMPSAIAHVSPELNTILLKALAKNPSDRYSQCIEMTSAIQKIPVPAPKLKKQPQVIKIPPPEKKQENKQEAKQKKLRTRRFRFFSLNPTLKYMTGSIVVIMLTFILASKLPDFLKRISRFESTPTVAAQDTFNLKMAAALKKEADAKFELRFFVSPPGNNALELYRKAFQANPADSAVIKRILIIRKKFLDEAKTALSSGQAQAAFTIISNGLYYFPQDSLLLKLKIHPEILNISQIRLSILNGAGVKGIARQLADYLRQNNFNIVETENYRINGRIAWNQKTSRLVGTIPENQDLIKLANLLGLTYEWTDSDQLVAGNVVLILGNDYRILPPLKE